MRSCRWILRWERRPSRSRTGSFRSSGRRIVRPVTDEEFGELLTSFDREAIHLETRDAYGTAVELPHMAKWAAGEPDDLEWLQGWCATLRAHVRAGKAVPRPPRAREPLSHCHLWPCTTAHALGWVGEHLL